MSDSLGLDEPPQPRSTAAQPYRVLARKYRPQTFGALIGQDAMVQTLGNAIKRDRLAHAFLLTGVRGVGKTSTARLIAKALNCIGPDGNGGPTIDPCGACEPCVAIAEGRHIDVVEMDAASHTGVDDIREIIEAVRYAAVSARYKVYIIDEVHMLSKSAFNALLKTLEEPPAHVKFLFATTEVNKVPVTVLSRCQRFDLRRIAADLLASHFAHVVEAEHVPAEPEALALIARAAEGSARDGLSILDQAIAHAGSEGGEVTAAQVREMLGLSDRGAIRRLFGHLLAGDVAAVLDGVAQQHSLGVEPAALLKGLLETVHGVTRAKAAAQTKAGEDPALSVEEREAFADWASRLGFATLHRLWQLLLKGHGEVHGAALPREAAEMALLRVLHASQMPDPQELLRRLESGTLSAAPAAPAAAPPAAAPSSEAPSSDAPAVAAATTRAPIVAAAESSPSATPPWEEEPAAPQMPATPALPADFEAMIALLEKSEPWLAQQIHDFASLIDYAPPALVVHPTRPLDMKKLGAALKAATGQTWEVSTSERPGAPTLLEQQRASENAHRDAILNSPIVAAARAAFPDAELIEDSRSASA